MKKPKLFLNKIDLHIHTTFSDGRCSIEECYQIAKKRQLTTIAITDHYSEFQPLPKRMGKGQLKYYLNALANLSFLKGVEAEILSDGTVSISKKTADSLDIVLGGLHVLHDRVFWNDPRPILNPKHFIEDLRVALIRGMESRFVDVLAHVTWLPEAIRGESRKLITDDWIKDVVKSASANNVAIEISGAWEVPDERFIKESIQQGVKVSIGSDAHEASQIGHTSYAIHMLYRLNIAPDYIFLPARETLY
ncbi:MAG: PHP domain-containing protein [Candidatus Bathyarchaeota archaeon]|nr:MAG: PHP domain-containing protein [Candidatus Bathyarchaeota archaeon]